MGRWKGNEPDVAKSTLLDGDDDVTLYLMDTSTDDFLSLKLIANGRQTGKANFWIGWDIKNDRFTRNRDALALAELWPEKIAFVKNTVAAHLLIWS